MKDKDGNFIRATHYVARKDDFQKALTDQGQLRVIAVYPDGSVQITNLCGYIREAYMNGWKWDVLTDAMKTPVSVVLL